jgi:hypothetical protein
MRCTVGGGRMDRKSRLNRCIEEEESYRDIRGIIEVLETISVCRDDGRVIERRHGPSTLNIHESSGCGGGIDTLSTARFSDGRADGLSITVNLTGTLNVRTPGFCYFRKKGWTDFNACLIRVSRCARATNECNDKAEYNPGETCKMLADERRYRTAPFAYVVYCNVPA